VRRKAILLVGAALLAGCGGGGKEWHDRTFSSPRVPFIFRYPDAFRARGLSVSLDPRNALVVRRASPRELDPDQYLGALRTSFARRGLRATARRERHAGREMGVLAVVVPAASPASGGHGPLHTTSRFFAAGGATWQLECRYADHRAEVVRGCRAALSSLRFR
jgi:hypothetical protein